MADIYRRVGGRPIQQYIAMQDGVADWMDEFVFEAAVRAEKELIEHRVSGDASIEIDIGRIDRYLILSDERGQKAALSIEFGRAAGEYTKADGTTVKVGAMEGLFILHKAMKLRKKRRAKVKLDY